MGTIITKRLVRNKAKYNNPNQLYSMHRVYQKEYVTDITFLCFACKKTKFDSKFLGTGQLSYNTVRDNQYYD